MYKIIGADQKEYGPISADQLRQWISEGRINANTKIQLEGSGVWKSASEFPEFSTVLPVLPPPLHTAPISMGPTPAPAKVNLTAVWAMVVGIVTLLCCQVLGPVGIILGCVALSQIKKSPGQTGSGFAIAGIVLGILALILVVIGILAMMFTPDFLTNIQNSIPH
jgi:hypothetical protein